MEKDAFYFPHFSNARHDRKIRRIRKDLGIEGYGVFFMLLEVLREQRDFKYPYKDVDLLADEFGTSTAKVEAIINAYDLFELDEEQQFFSPKFMFYMQPYLRMLKQKRLAGIKSGEARRAKTEKANTSPTEDNDSSTDVERSFNDSSTDDERQRTKERKGNEMKGNEKDLSVSQSMNSSYVNREVNTLPKIIEAAEVENFPENTAIFIKRVITRLFSYSSFVDVLKMDITHEEIRERLRLCRLKHLDAAMARMENCNTNKELYFAKCLLTAIVERDIEEIFEEEG